MTLTNIYVYVMIVNLPAKVLVVRGGCGNDDNDDLDSGTRAPAQATFRYALSPPAQCEYPELGQ